MPSNIIFDIPKEKLIELLAKQKSKSTSLKMNLDIEILFSSESEIESLSKFMEENKQLEYVKINLPGSFNFEDLLTEELSKERVPNLKITIKENIEKFTTTTGFNEFH